jgi:hypothetical protein
LTGLGGFIDPAGLPFRDINTACAFLASIGLTFTLLATSTPIESTTTTTATTTATHYHSWSSVWFITTLMISLSISIILTIRQVLLLVRFKIYQITIPWNPKGALIALAILNICSYLSLLIAYVLIGIAFFYGVDRSVGVAWLVVVFTVIPIALGLAAVLVCGVFQWIDGWKVRSGVGGVGGGVGEEGVLGGKEG